MPLRKPLFSSLQSRRDAPRMVRLKARIRLTNLGRQLDAVREKLAGQFQTEHELPEKEARKNADSLLNFLHAYVIQNSVHVGPKDWKQLLEFKPNFLLNLGKQYAQLQLLEQNRLKNVEWPKIPNVDYHIRVGSLEQISGGDTADILHISTHPILPKGREVSYYWVHNIDWAGKGLVSNLLREISQMKIRELIKNIEVDPADPGAAAKHVASQLHLYLEKHVLPEFHPYFAVGPMGVLAVEHGGHAPSKVDFHHLDFGSDPMIVHDPAKTGPYQLRLTKDAGAMLDDHDSGFSVTRNDQTELLPFLIQSPDEYVTRTLPIEPNHTLLIYTDGLTEARDAQGVFFGRKLLRVLTEIKPGSAKSIIKQVMASWEKHTLGTTYPLDDLRITGIRHVSGTPTP